MPPQRSAGEAAVVASLLLLLSAAILMYLSMPSAVGRGPGAALGVVAIGLVAAGTRAATVLARRSGAASYRG